MQLERRIHLLRNIDSGFQRNCLAAHHPALRCCSSPVAIVKLKLPHYLTVKNDIKAVSFWCPPTVISFVTNDELHGQLRSARDGQPIMPEKSRIVGWSA